MTIADLITEFGAYYKDEGQNQNSIYQQLKRDFVTAQAFTVVMTDDTIWKASEATHSRIVQPFQKAFTPTGAATFTPVEIRQFHLKADLSEYPDDVENMWLGFLASHNVKRTEWPFVRFWMEQLIIPKIQEDTEINEIGIGSYVAPTNGVAGAAGTSMDGILKVLGDHITAGRIVPQALGAIPTNDDKLVVQYFEEFHKGLDKRYRNQPMTVYCSEDTELAFLRGYGELYGQRTVMTAAEETSMKVKHTNLTVKGLPSLNYKLDGTTANDQFFCTPKANAIMLQKKTENMKRFDIQAYERMVKLLTDWWMGVGVIIPEIVFMNDGAPEV